MTTAAHPSELPAIAGGAPAKTTPFTRATRYGDEELQQLREALDQQTLFYAQGKKTFELERRFAEVIGTKHAVACSSATAAIHAAVIGLDVSPGDEVIVAPITDMGSILPILWQGAIPVFADLDPISYNVTADTVARCITGKTRAILAVHLAGNSCDLDPLVRLARDRGIPLIEDCAQAHGTTYRGKPVGSFGRIGCFSFNEFKHIACGDGGVCVTDDEQLAKKLRLATDKAYDRSPGVATRDPRFLANNYRMTELQAAVAIAQLEKLPSIVARRRSWCDRLTRAISDLAGLQFPRAIDGCGHSWWFYMMRVEPQVLGVTADDFAAAMKAEGVPVAAHYIGRCVYEYPLFANHSAFAHGPPHPFADRRYAHGDCPVAEQILDTCVILPINEGHNDTDLDETARAFRRVVGWLQQKRNTG
jgi:dTDP-4-amino-4,6-dideoxygalactose transaminase